MWRGFLKERDILKSNGRKPPTGDADHGHTIAGAPIMDHAGVDPWREEAILEPVQIATIAQNFAGIFSAALFRAAAFHIDQPFSWRRDGDSSESAGAPLL